MLSYAFHFNLIYLHLFRFMFLSTIGGSKPLFPTSIQVKIICCVYLFIISVQKDHSNIVVILLHTRGPTWTAQ